MDDCPFCGGQLMVIKVHVRDVRRCLRCECLLDPRYPASFGIPAGPTCPLCGKPSFRAKAQHQARDGRVGTVFVHACQVDDSGDVRQGGHFLPL